MPDAITSNSTKSVINRLWAEQKPTTRGTTRDAFSVGFAISRDHIPWSADLYVTVAGSQMARKPCTGAAGLVTGTPAICRACRHIADYVSLARHRRFPPQERGTCDERGNE